MGKNQGKNDNSGGSLAEAGERLWGHFRMLHLGYTIMAALGFTASCLLWAYVFMGAEAISKKILLVELIVALIMLAAYLYRTFFVGYDDRVWRNIRITWAVSSLLSLIGFYIAGISLIGPATGDSSGGAMYIFMRLITNLFAAMALSVIPALLISFANWCLVRVIEFFTGA